MEVHMNEWAFTQGMVGYKRILENAGIKVPITTSGIIIKKDHLELLPEAYFNFFIDKYSVARQNKRILSIWHHKWKNGDNSAKKDLNTRLRDLENRVKKYFADTTDGKRLLENITVYRNEKNYSEALDKQLNEIINGLATKEINEKLTVNSFKAIHLNPYFGQPSFLNVSKSSLSVQEQKELFQKDYIDPVLEEWRFMQLLEQGDVESCRNFLEETPHPSLARLKTPFKKKEIDEMKNYIRDEILKCSLTDFPLGFFSLEESVFSPLSVSLKNALNSTWDSGGKNFYPISALAKLILFCSPAGATITNRKSVFIQLDGSFQELYHINQHYHYESDRDKSFDEIIFDIVREQHLKADYINRNFLILEYESDYSAKKTILDYMILTPHMVKLFNNHSNLFKNIHYTNKVSFIKLLLKNIDTKHFISRLLREKIKNNYSSLEIMFMTLLRYLNQIYQKEAEIAVDTKKKQDYVWVLYKSGEQIRNKIGLKKAQGIAYRLLNSVQSGNKNTFMDTVMRVYISSDVQMPSLLLEALHENKMDFPTVANAWVAGLISKPNDEGADTNE